VEKVYAIEINNKFEILENSIDNDSIEKWKNKNQENQTATYRKG